MNKIFVPFLPPWVETGLQPAFYDKESGTVLQQTARMYNKVNCLIRNFNQLSKETKETVDEYVAKFTELKDFVDNYFDNLDVQEEINTKLDDMAEDGTLQEIITAYIQANVAWTFDTVADMKLATNLVDGSYAQTLGFHSVNDGGGALYKISDSGTADEMQVIAVGDLYATIILPAVLAPEQVGCYGNGTTDDTTAFAKACNLSSKVEGNGTYAIAATTLNNVKIKADIKSISNAGITLNNNVEYSGKFVSKYPTVGEYSAGFKVVGSGNYIHDAEFSALDNRCTIAIDIFNSASNLKISKCVFKPDYKVDIMTSGNDLIIEDCIFEAHTDITLSPISEYSNGIKLSQNTYDEVTSANGNNIVIKNNTILAHGDNPIDSFTGATNVVIDGNYIVSDGYTNIEIKVTSGDYGTEGNYNYTIANNIMDGSRNLFIRKLGSADFYNFNISNNIFTSSENGASCVIIEGSPFNYNIDNCTFNGNGSNSAFNIAISGTDVSSHIISNCVFNNFNSVFLPGGDNYEKIFVSNCTAKCASFIRPYTHMEVYINNCDIVASSNMGVNIEGKMFCTNSRLQGNYIFVCSSSDAVVCANGCKIDATTGIFNRGSSSVKFKYALVACDLSGSPALPYYTTETLALNAAS